MEQLVNALEDFFISMESPLLKSQVAKMLQDVLLKKAQGFSLIDGLVKFN